mmetsp:Transcript_15434/g.31682  ORF Transcript_15434/g.31682 Transcript_15434/m.31682 type:complete len:111 (-) Transcript_15434:177-509(-)
MLGAICSTSPECNEMHDEHDFRQCTCMYCGLFLHSPFFDHPSHRASASMQGTFFELAAIQRNESKSSVVGRHSILTSSLEAPTMPNICLRVSSLAKLSATDENLMFRNGF